MTANIADLVKLATEYEHLLPAMPAENPALTEPIATLVDQTLLKPEKTTAELESWLKECRNYPFPCVAIHPVFIPTAVKILAGSGVGIDGTVGFPFGATPTAMKVAETKYYLSIGATEIDMVIPFGRLKGGEYQAVLDDIVAVVEEAKKAKALTKAIIETCYLTRFEKIMACLLTEASGAAYVKTTTGFGPGKATFEDVELMRRVVGPNFGVKAAGGMNNLADARRMLAAGANRLGSSLGMQMAREEQAEKSSQV
jgi:deoxyribose-phosphate aldolase